MSINNNKENPPPNNESTPKTIQKMKTTETQIEKGKTPNAVDVNPAEFSVMKNAFSAKQDLLAGIAVKDSYDIPFTDAEDPNDLTKILKHDKLLTVHYHEMSNGQWFALSKKKAMIDDLERVITNIALQKKDAKEGKKEYENENELSTKLLNMKDEYYNILFTLLLDLPVDKRERCSRIILYQVAEGWEMRTRFSLPNLANDSGTSSGNVYR